VPESTKAGVRWAQLAAGSSEVALRFFGMVCIADNLQEPPAKLTSSGALRALAWGFRQDQAGW